MPTISLASNAADSEALETIERQHAELVGGLSTRTAALLAAVRRDAGWEGARDALVTWCRAALIRHHEAEEAVLYPATRELPALEPLVRAMAHEHALLGALVARLASTDDAPSAVAQAGAAQTLFETHVAKANDLLLPALVAARDTSVAQLLAEMHTMLRGAEQGVAEAAENPEHRPAEGPPGHVCGCHDEPDAAPELDARTIPHAIRHATIFGALEAVAPAASLILVAPHDPLPLLQQIEQRWPSAFAVEYVERGPETWRLRFTRTAAEPATR